MQDDRFSPRYLFIFALLAIAIVLDSGLTRDEQHVGIDSIYFLSRLLEGITFFRAQGLSIPWYSPAFCGGVPFFANPQSLFYSLPQFLAFVVNPWTAMRLTYALMILIAGVGSALFLRRIFSCSAVAAACGGVFFASNGFLFSHLLVGHLSYHSFALIPLLLWGLLDKQLSTRKAIVLLGCLAAYFVHSGGYYTSLLALLSVLMVLGMVFGRLLGPASGTVAFAAAWQRGFFGALLGLGLAGAKLLAMLALTAHVPREVHFTVSPSIMATLQFAFVQLFGFVRQTAEHPLPWEACAFLHPFVFVAVIACGIAYWKSKSSLSQQGSLERRLALLVLVVTVVGTLGLLHGAPQLEAAIRWFGAGSLRCNERFAGAFVFPLCVLAAQGIQLFFQSRGQRFLFIAVIITAPILMSMGIVLIRGSVGWTHREASIIGLGQLDQAVRSAAISMHPQIIRYRGWNDLRARQKAESVVRCYDPLYLQAVPGRGLAVDDDIRRVAEGEFNILNPSCLLFPEENRCEPGDRIPVTDVQKFESFLARRGNPWKLSRLQVAVNWLSFLLFVAVVLSVIVGVVQFLFAKRGDE